jgi:hydroxymethylpyrimidine/phosphomethylpyrimidine kinase
VKTRVALTIAGSDPSGGAGVQADLKTFAAHGVYGTSAITLLTVQNTQGVRAVQVLDPEFVTAQLETVLTDMPVAAVKTGALGSEGIIRAVARVLRQARLPVVVDPVIVAKSGDLLLELSAIEALRAELLPVATLVTPNVREAEEILGLAQGEIQTGEDLRRLAHGQVERPLLLKGGHLEGAQVCDYLVLAGRVEEFSFERIRSRHTHGTGCTLSAAITARLALGEPLPHAVAQARQYLQDAIRQAPGLGGGHGPLEHFPTKSIERSES